MTASPEMIIRPAAAADEPALGRLGAMLVALHHDFDPDRFIAPGPHTEAGYARFLTGRIGRQDAVLLVAEHGGAVTGYVFGSLEGADWMSLRGPAGVVHDLIVDPDRRGGGIGRRLLEAALQALRDLGAPRVVLSTAQRNESAQRLFAAIGFRPTMIEMTREWPD